MFKDRDLVRCDLKKQESVGKAPRYSGFPLSYQGQKQECSEQCRHLATEPSQQNPELCYAELVCESSLE